MLRTVTWQRDEAVPAYGDERTQSTTIVPLHRPAMIRLR